MNEGPGTHRARPGGIADLLHGTLGKLALAGAGILAAAATAFVGFIVTKVEDLGKQTDEFVEQVSDGLDRTNAQLDNQAETGEQELRRLLDALRDLQSPPPATRPTDPAPRPDPAARPGAGQKPRPTPAPRLTTQQPPTPTPGALDAFCATTKLCPDQEDQ